MPKCGCTPGLPPGGCSDRKPPPPFFSARQLPGILLRKVLGSKSPDARPGPGYIKALGGHFAMEKRIVLVDADDSQCREIAAMLSGIEVNALHTLAELEEHLSGGGCRVVLLDLDTVPIDDRALARLKRRHPRTQIIAKSVRRFHPELEEALRSHLLSCLAKPLDPDELVFWLKSIFDNSAPEGGGGQRRAPA